MSALEDRMQTPDWQETLRITACAGTRLLDMRTHFTRLYRLILNEATECREKEVLAGKYKHEKKARQQVSCSW